ncbi:unnamed protein product [Ilex paraguariensis]|uniref:RING-type domain-containing protein n=1 Tax=Ilex paraguariensis TaxID=185542 RepID=A0ABC8SVI0_9AQUA
MGFSSFTIKTLNFIVLILDNLLLDFIKHLHAMLLSCIHLLKRACLHEQNLVESEVKDRPSPSLVPVPVHFIVGLVKEQLPIIEYSCLLERLGACKKDEVCAVCLGCIKESEEVRELCGCAHVYHRECLDGWIDEGQITCPLCRSKILPDKGEDQQCGGDSWRKERMMYLFGEDYVMGT